jgi:hypothetical protein
MTQVERRQARIQKIYAKNAPNLATTSAVKADEAPPSPEAHHVIGKTENFPEDVGSFYRENQEDPAFQVMHLRLIVPSLSLPSKRTLFQSSSNTSCRASRPSYWRTAPLSLILHRMTGKMWYSTRTESTPTTP